MHCGGGERRNTYRDVLGALVAWSAVSNPFTAPGDYGLARMHFEHTLLGLHPKCAFEHHRKLVKIRLLAGFTPTRRTPHVSDAYARVA